VGAEKRRALRRRLCGKPQASVPQAAPEQLGRPVETKQDRRYAGEGSSLLHKLLTDVTDKIAGNTPNTEK